MALLFTSTVSKKTIAWCYDAKRTKNVCERKFFKLKKCDPLANFDKSSTACQSLASPAALAFLFQSPSDPLTQPPLKWGSAVPMLDGTNSHPQFRFPRGPFRFFLAWLCYFQEYRIEVWRPKFSKYTMHYAQIWIQSCDYPFDRLSDLRARLKS